MKFRKSILLLSLVLTLSMALSACAGKGNETGGTASSDATQSAGNGTDAGQSKQEDSNAPDTSEFQNLKMVLLGAKPADFDEVWSEVNKKIKEKINATIDVQFLDWSDWTQKYPLMFASNDDFDLVYTANWAFYSDQARKGGFMELTDDMLQKYAPAIWSRMSQVAWGQAKVKGKLYMVPNNNQNEFLNKLVLIREDLRQKYNLPEVTDMASMANYLKTVAKNEKDMIAFDSTPQGKGQFNELDEAVLLYKNNWRLIDPTLPLAYKLDDPKGQLFDIYETPEFKELMDYYKDLANNGVWSKDILNRTSSGVNQFQAGKNGMETHNLGTLANDLETVQQKYPQYKAALADVAPNSMRQTAISTQNGMAIHAGSKKWQRALMAVDLLQTDKEIHDLSVYGIAGKHYIPVGDDKMKPGPDKNNYGISSWAWDASDIKRQDENYPQQAIDINNSWAQQVYHWPLETFVFDNGDVKTEASNIAQAMIRYGAPLEYGMIDDLQGGEDQLLSQVKKAGLDKVMQIAQKQIDDFLAEQQ